MPYTIMHYIIAIPLQTMFGLRQVICAWRIQNELWRSPWWEHPLHALQWKQIARRALVEWPNHAWNESLFQCILCKYASLDYWLNVECSNCHRTPLLGCHEAPPIHVVRNSVKSIIQTLRQEPYIHFLLKNVKPPFTCKILTTPRNCQVHTLGICALFVVNITHLIKCDLYNKRPCKVVPLRYLITCLITNQWTTVSKKLTQPVNDIRDIWPC